jgi:hypothetical protein
VSHVAARIVANWLQDATYGVNAIAALVPRDGTDAAPPAVHVYNETQHGWVARNQVPKPVGTTIQFPAVIVFLQNARYDSGVPDSQSTGARTVDATVQLAVQLIHQDSATEDAVIAGMYILRAIRNSLLQLDDPARDDARTLTGIQLNPSQSVMQGQLDAPVGDSTLSLGALVVQYPTTEITALT